MSAAGFGRRAGRSRGVDLALAVLAVALTAFTAVVVAVPAVAPAVVNDRFDVGIITAAFLVSGAVAALDWARGRVAYDPAALLRSSAFALLALLNGLVLLTALTGTDAALGATLDDPGQLPLYASVIARGGAAILLIAGGSVALSRWAPNLRPVPLLLVPGFVVLALLAIATTIADSLPPLAPARMLDSLAVDPTAAIAPGSAPALTILQSLIGAGFLAAAVLGHRSFRRSGRSADALLAAGLLVAAFSQVHSAIHPGSYAGVVTTGDMLRLAFYGILLVGVVAESREDLANLRAAMMEVRRLAQAEFAAAALEERARLAREIHDGLAQELWYAKLKQSRLAQVVGFEGEAEQLSGEVESAIDTALAEARHAVAAMRGGSESGPLLETLRRQVEDFADRFAVRAEFVRDGGGGEPEVGPRAQAELIRIVQEALTNVRKHADATVVRVHVETDPDLRIAIVDNGRGFKPDEAPPGFGLESMRQRADVIGARLSVTSAPQDGSRVELVLPLPTREGAGER